MATKREILETESMLTRLTQCLSDACSNWMMAHEGRPCGNPHDHRDDADALRRISMTLHRWHELECGIDGGCIERDESTGKTYWLNAMTGRRYPTPDRETGARKRLAAIMARYPTLTAYVQTDPRGCALYILRPGDVPEGGDVSSYYTRGIAVHR